MWTFYVQYMGYIDGMFVVVTDKGSSESAEEHQFEEAADALEFFSTESAFAGAHIRP